jgi:pre-mRNA-processing factor 39
VQEDIEKSRAVFDSFLSEYPLCYGYWKKYADAEVKHGNAELAGHVYERGVSSIPYSVDLWGHFVAYKQSTGGSPDEIRACVVGINSCRATAPC